MLYYYAAKLSKPERAYVNKADNGLWNHKTILMFSTIVAVPLSSENFFLAFFLGLPYHWFNYILKLVY